MVNLLFPAVVTYYKRKCVHEVLVNGLVKLAQETVWLLVMTIAFEWDVKSQTKQANNRVKCAKYETLQFAHVLILYIYVQCLIANYN